MICNYLGSSSLVMQKHTSFVIGRQLVRILALCSTTLNKVAWFSSAYPDKWQDSILKYVMARTSPWWWSQQGHL